MGIFFSIVFTIIFFLEDHPSFSAGIIGAVICVSAVWILSTIEQSFKPLADKYPNLVTTWLSRHLVDTALFLLFADIAIFLFRNLLF